MAKPPTEAETYNRYFYPGPEPRVPIDRLGIRHRALLQEAEAYFVERRAAQGLPPPAMEITYAGFKAIHKHLFQDLYGWAGKERTYTTGRNLNVSFAPPEHITVWMEAQFTSLRSDNFLRHLGKETFASKAAVLVIEINAAHPFIDGNGRVQRLWLQLIAEQAGHRLDIRPDDRNSWNHAAYVGFMQTPAPLADFIFARLA